MSTVTSSGRVLETNGFTSVVRRGALLTVAGEQRLSERTTTIEGLQRTYRANRGYLLVKPSAGSAEVFHFDTDLNGFYTHENGKGVSVNPEPVVDFSVAQGYQADASGNLLLDECCQKPILGPMVEFNDLLISGTIIGGKTDKRLLALRANNSKVPLSLFMQEGKMTFKRSGEPLGSFIQLEHSAEAPDYYLACEGGNVTDTTLYADFIAMRGTTVLPNIPDEEKGDVILKTYIRAL